jgi:hypothetical protein
MSKFTRDFKKYKNKTVKKGGRYRQVRNSNEFDEKPHREGIIDKYENKLSETASTVENFAVDTGLRLFGLKRINQNDENNEYNKNNLDQIRDSSSEILNNIERSADKTGANVIGNVNEVLGSDYVNQTTEQAARDTAQLVKIGAEKFNEALDKPEVKEELKKAIRNAGELGSVMIEAGKEPFNKAVDVAAEATQKATSAALSGAVKVGTDVLAAVPFFGAIIDVGKMVNDGSRAASAVNEASSEAIEAVSDAFIETKKNFEIKLKELEEKKRIAQQISNRTTNSIKEFEAPIQSGGYKTRRRLFKRKAKSKRVRFAI